MGACPFSFFKLKNACLHGVDNCISTDYNEIEIKGKETKECHYFIIFKIP